MKSPQANSKYRITLPATLAAKTALYEAMHSKKLTNVASAKKLTCNEKEIRRLLDPYYYSKFPKIERALKALGLTLEVGIWGE